MTGHQNICAVTFGLSALLNVGLNIVLIPLFGIEGAAAATAFTMALWNVTLIILVKRRLDIDWSPFAALRQSV